MAEAVIGGLGQNQSASGAAEVDYGGVGTPVFDGTIETNNDGPILQPTFDNTSKDEFVTGAIGTPVFDGGIDVLNTGLSQQDPNSNRSLQVELGGQGTPIFPGVAQTNLPVPIDDPNNRKNIEVELLGTGTPRFGNDVRFITGPILNVGG